MPSPTKHLMIIAGEASGDTHAAHLVDEIKKINPGITFSGLGGPKMRKSGVELRADLTQIAVVGFVEVLKHYREFKRYFDLFLEEALRSKPDAVILVDYPGFNLRMAKALKKNNIKVIYYISPQVWAWKEERVKMIRECVDRMLVLFSFEKDFYAQHGVDVDFVGHPLVDDIGPRSSRADTLEALHLNPGHLTVGLLPGSRLKEVELMLPVMLEAAEMLHLKFPNTQFLLVKAPTVPDRAFTPFLKNKQLPLRVTKDDYYTTINACDICLVTSGTATLETAVLIKPMVVIYKTSFLTWLMAKTFIKIPYIGLVNVVARKKIVPECIQYDATAPRIANTLGSIISDETRIADIKTELKKVKSALGESGGSRRAAEKIVGLIS